MRFVRLLIILALLPLVAVYGQNVNTIRGKVRAANGTPVNNAIVELRLHGALLSQTVTRNEGDFDFSGLAPAEYEVAVTASGYESTIQVARFTQSERTSFREVLHVEILVRPKVDALQPVVGVNFAQEAPKAARQAYEEGLERLREGKADEGLARLRQAVALFADYFAANFALARELFVRGRDDEALEAVERARAVNDREAAVYHLFGLIMFRQGKFMVAEYAFREAVKLNANIAIIHFFRGRALLELAAHSKEEKARADYLTEAEKELDKAWELSDEKLADVHLQRARIHERRGSKEAAARALEAYLKAEPGAPNAAQIKQAIADLRKK